MKNLRLPARGGSAYGGKKLILTIILSITLGVFLFSEAGYGQTRQLTGRSGRPVRPVPVEPEDEPDNETGYGDDESGYGDPEGGYGKEKPPPPPPPRRRRPNRWGTDGTVTYITDPEDLLDESIECDYLIIVSPDLFSSGSLDVFANYRAHYSDLDIVIVSVDDIYEQFSKARQSKDRNDNEDGATKAFIRWACNNWNVPPEYLLLVGDVDHVPSHQEEHFGHIMDDEDWYVDIDFDGWPDIAMGRFPVGNEQELINMILKTYRYEQNPIIPDDYHGSVLYVHPEFESLQELIELLESLGFDVTELNGTSGDSIDDLINAVNQGQNIIFWHGHGGTSSWSFGGRGASEDFTDEHLELLHNLGIYPIIITSACNTADLDQGQGSDSIGELLAILENAGAVAYYGATIPTGVSFIANKELLEIFFNNPDVYTIGQLILLAERQFEHWSAHSYILLGDPALQIFGRPLHQDLPDLTIPSSAGSYDAETQELTVNVQNIGSVDAEDVLVVIAIIDNVTGEAYPLTEVTIPVIPAGETATVPIDIESLPWPAEIDRDSGYDIVVIIDPENNVPESFEFNNWRSGIYNMPSNNPPYFLYGDDGEVSEMTVFVGVEYIFAIAAGDPDGDPLEYSAYNLPPGATFDGHTLTWTPTGEGFYEVLVRVTDGSASIYETLRIWVKEDPDGDRNRDIIFEPLPEDEGNNVDNTDTNESLTLETDPGHSWDAEPAANLDIYIDQDNVATITPDYDWEGSEAVTFTAEDYDGEADSTEVTFTVAKDSKELQDLVDIAYIGEELEIEPGTYVFTSDLVIDKDITLKAIDPANTTFILGDYCIIIKEADGSDKLEDVVLEGITITGHTGKSIKGPIQNYSRSLTLKDCKIIDNKGIKASAIYTSYKSNLYLENTLIAKNINIPRPDMPRRARNRVLRYKGRHLNPELYCGTIYLGGLATLHLKDSTIADNIDEARLITIESGHGRRELKVNYGAIHRSWFNKVDITNSIMWNNGNTTELRGFSHLIKLLQKRNITNSDIQQEDIPGIGEFEDVISEDPEFDNNYTPQNQSCNDMGAK